MGLESDLPFLSVCVSHTYLINPFWKHRHVSKICVDGGDGETWKHYLCLVHYRGTTFYKGGENSHFPIALAVNIGIDNGPEGVKEPF